MNEKGQPSVPAGEQGEQRIESAKFPEKKLNAQERKEVRERVGAESAKEYLEPADDDSPRARELKEKVKGMDIEQTIGAVMGTDDPEMIAKALDMLGMKKKEIRRSNGNVDSQWTLKNPDPAIKETLADTFADKEHLKAFIVGFATAETFKDQAKVIYRIYEYLGLQPPKFEEVFAEEEEAEEEAEDEDEKAVDVVPPPEAGAEDEDEASPEVEVTLPEQAEAVAEDEDEDGDEELPVKEKEEDRKKGATANPPLSKWKGFMSRLGAKTRRALLPLGIITLLSAIQRDYGPETEMPPKEEARIEMVQGQETEAETRIEIGESVYSLKKGDTVYTVVKEMLGELGDDKGVLEATVKGVLNDNDIADASFGTQGTFDSTKLDIGTKLDMKRVQERIRHQSDIAQAKGDIENL